LHLLWTLALVSLLTASVQAQDYSYPRLPPPSESYETQPMPPPASKSKPPPERKHRGLQGGLNIGVPLFLDVDRNVVRPGADIHGFGGYDMGYAMFGLDLGAMWTPIDLRKVSTTPPEPNLERSPVTRLHFAPEVRVQIPNQSRILPYVAITFDANWWQFRETAIGCGFWYCAQFKVFRFTPGFTAKGGMAFRIREGVHIDVGFKYSLSGPGNFFLRREQWITPYIGVLGR
jgi:hypothetical protein